MCNTYVVPSLSLLPVLVRGILGERKIARASPKVDNILLGWTGTWWFRFKPTCLLQFLKTRFAPMGLTLELK